MKPVCRRQLLCLILLSVRSDESRRRTLGIRLNRDAFICKPRISVSEITELPSAAEDEVNIPLILWTEEQNEASNLSPHSIAVDSMLTKYATVTFVD